MGYTNEEIDKFNLQDYLLYSIPTEEDLTQCKQLMMFYIFRTKIYNEQIFYDDICYWYFGEGYITKFTDDDTKAGCRVLSYWAIDKKEKITSCQTMNIYNHPQAIYLRFTYFYYAELKKMIYSIIGFIPITTVFSQLQNKYQSRRQKWIYIINFLDVWKLYQHYNIQEKYLSEKMNKMDVLLSNEHLDMKMNFNALQYFQVQMLNYYLCQTTKMIGLDLLRWT